MGRTPEYDRDSALAEAARLFGELGYAGCSVDDLVRRLGIHRGSLYKAFGSKRGLFLEALRRHVDTALTDLAAKLAAADSGDRASITSGAADLDLILVAAPEGGHDPRVAEQLTRALSTVGSACSGTEEDAVAARTAGLGLLSCRMASFFVSGRELEIHLSRLSQIVG